VRDLVKRAPAIVFEDSSLREAADHLLRENVGRLPVVRRDEPTKMIGLLTRSDILAAHRRRLGEVSIQNPGIALHGTGLLLRRRRT
jgi:predicted transcriptional regulator